MVFTWLDAIKHYLSVEAAMKDWTFAWMLDDHSPVVKILDALKYKQALLLKTALVGTGRPMPRKFSDHDI